MKHKKNIKKELSESFISEDNQLNLDTRFITCYEELIDHINQLSNPIHRAAFLTLIKIYNITPETFKRLNK